MMSEDYISPLVLTDLAVFNDYTSLSVDPNPTDDGLHSHSHICIYGLVIDSDSDA